MTTEEMRDVLMRMYGTRWRNRVRRMSGAQVTAVYLKFKNERKLT